MKKTGDRTIAALVVLVSVLLLLQSLVFLLTVTVHSQNPTTGHFTGASGTGVVGFTFIGTSTCSMPLVNGWNLISLCSNVSDNSIASLLNGVDIRFVMRWNQSTQRFAVYSPSAASPDFSTMEFNQSYFVYLNSASSTVSLRGDNFTDTQAGLGTGWNAPGYPYGFSTNITRYFNETKHRYLLKWNATGQKFLIYSPRAAEPAFTIINGSEGQFVFATQSDIIQYNRSQLES